MEIRKRILVFVLLGGIAALEGRTILEDEKQNNLVIYKILFHKIRMEREFETCMIYGSVQKAIQDDFIVKHFQMKLKKPLLLHRAPDSFEISVNFNKEILLIVYIEEAEIKAIVDRLAAKLNRMRQVRILFIWSNLNGEVAAGTLTKFFSYCQHYNMLNVLVLLEDFAVTTELYSYTVFPMLQLEKRKFNPTAIHEIFPNRMVNFHGHKLQTLPDQVTPSYMLYYNRKGELIHAGYVGKFLKLLAGRYNATLTFPSSLKIDEEFAADKFYNLTHNNTLDISGSLWTPHRLGNLDEFSYPYELSRWCAMVPLRRYKEYIYFFRQFLRRFIWTAAVGILVGVILMKSRKMYYIHMGTPIEENFVDYIVNAHTLSAIVGVSFNQYAFQTASMRMAYRVVLLIGVLYGTFTISEMKKSFTDPSTKNRFIRTLDDFTTSGLQLLMSRKEYEEIFTVAQRNFYSNTFQIVDDAEEYDKARTDFNTSYAYVITSAEWYIINTEQKQFSQPLFRYSNVCYRKLIYNSFLLPPNSMYQELVNLFIMRARAMGLLDYWLRNTFYDLVANGRRKFKDIPIPSGVRILELIDYFYIFVILGGILIGSCFILLLEIYIYRRKKVQKKLENKIREKRWKRIMFLFRRHYESVGDAE